MSKFWKKVKDFFMEDVNEKVVQVHLENGRQKEILMRQKEILMDKKK